MLMTRGGGCDGPVSALPRATAPDPEVPATVTRRRFSVEYRLRILKLADACKKPGDVGALLRREGLYSSHLTQWRPQRVIAEIGTDMTRWPSAKHFTSWLTLAPRNKITGGRLISSRTLPSANRAAAMFRMCAMSAGRTSTALGAFYRRLAYRVGKAKAITATARKLALLVYRMLRDRIPYRESSAADYDQHHRSRVLRGLRKRAASLGCELVDTQTGLVM